MTHDWVRITQQAVDVIEDPVVGGFYTVDRPGEPIGEAVGCDSCGVSMVDASMPCVPIDTSLPLA